VAAGGDVRMCLLGSKKHILLHAESLGIHNFDRLIDIVDPLKDESRATRYAEQLFEIRQRRGVSRTGAFQLLRNHNYFASMMVHLGEADGLVSGLLEPYAQAARPVLEIIGTVEGQILAGIYLIIANQKMYFFSDCTINIDPDAETLANIAMTTASIAGRYTKDPIRVAMLSFTSFGATKHPLTEKVAKATTIVREKMPELEIEGEMQADVALNDELRQQEFPFSQIKGSANVLIFPGLSSANIAYKLLTNLSDATPIGPILVGVKKPANILQRSATSDEIVNLICLTGHQVITARPLS
jgi:malate dehydrogenase (oxaloacetate-decarboxylating)(NADP+)